ncbi:MAG: RluA family pseudouridine synthase [Deltaproteobacteria bacterium]|nr:RluA family pseudouridine synthase [Deltaproteobacteria bacterium]
MPWSRVRRMIESGKVRVDHQTQTDPGHLVLPDQHLEIVPNAPRPATRSRLSGEAIAFVDDHVVVVRKPPGISAVPFEQGERGTLHELVRAWLNRSAASRNDRATGDLGIVHRIDKDTSGLLVFTRTLLAKRHLTQQFRFHTVERVYFAIAQGRVDRTTFRSRIVQDRGDGLRGSTRDPRAGQEATTHVEPIERFDNATLLRCRLETGRTHQIRIHLSEAGHPLLGEPVYTRSFAGPLLRAPRLMLHAAVLGFEHPIGHRIVRFEDPLPEDMLKVLQALRKESAR